MTNERSTFWDTHWWKPLIILGAVGGIAASGFGIQHSQATTQQKNEACWDKGGQMYEGLCVSSPVQEVSK